MQRMGDIVLLALHLVLYVLQFCQEYYKVKKS